MAISRRLLLAGCAMPALSAKKPAGIRIGVTDWNLKQSGKLEAIALAKRIGFEGVEVSLSRASGTGRLLLEDPALVRQYLAEGAKHKIAFAGTCLLNLNQICLVTERLAQNWLAAAIPITAKLKARVILVPFFGKCELKQPSQIDTLVGILKEHAPAAQKARVVLGIENYLSAKENMQILDRVASRAVKVYYDLKNSKDAGHDPYQELKLLGAARICQIHIKDKGYLGEGIMDYKQGMEIIRAIGYRGFANLELSAPSGSIENDMRRNLEYIRQLM